jgi:hypothetical protein
MDPNSHPHGGGEGRSPVGMPGPKTPWGKPAMGYKTARSRSVYHAQAERGVVTCLDLKKFAEGNTEKSWGDEPDGNGG